MVFNKKKLKALKHKTTEFNIPELGDECFLLRSISSNDYTRLHNKYGDIVDEDDDKANEFLFQIIAMTVVDDEGDKVFSEDESDELRDLPMGVINKLAKACIELHGMGNSKKN